MSRWSSVIVLFCLGALIAETLCAPTDEPIIVRSKRQQCRCVKNPNGGLTCSCAKGPANGSSATSNQIGTGAQYDVPQSTDIANQLTQMSQQSTGLGTARCGCIQIVFQGAPQYNCQCGDQNGNALPTTTTMAPTTPSTTTTTTTTTPAPTTTTTQPTTTTQQLPVSYPNSQGNQGACNCIMISITSPQTAQYQCQCAQPQQQQQPTQEIIQVDQSNFDYQDAEEYGAQTAIPGTLPAPPTTTPIIPTASMYTASPPTVYPAIGQLATEQQSCYCLDPTTSIMSSCGCRCNCATLMVSVPHAYCGCPQPGQAQYAETYDYTYTVPPTTTTAPSTTPSTTTTTAPIVTSTSQQMYADAPTATQYPLTTTCVMYVNVPTSACSCLPQYDQCAQNVCCLKAKYRSYKKSEEQNPSTIDMLMNVLQTIKTKWE